MGDLESLLLILAVIYVAECAVWAPLHAVAFSSWFGRRWCLRYPGGLTGNNRGGFIFAHPLPPLGNVLVSCPLPLSLSSDGVYAYTAACLSPSGRPSQTCFYAPFEALDKIRSEGKKIYVNNQLLLKAGSTALAREGVELLRSLKALPKAQRAEAIKKNIAQTLNTKTINERLTAYRARSKPMRLLSNFLFIYLFLFAPVVLWRFGFGNLAIGLLGGLLAHTITLAILFRRAHKVLFPAGAEERFTPFLTMLLAPPTAIRAPDILARHLLENFHPLALAQVLCPPDFFKTFARQVLNDLRFPILPICPPDPAGASAIEEWSRKLWLATIEQFLEKQGLRLAELKQPPAPLEPCNRAYCPRCHAQFIKLESTCAECGGRPLEALPLPSATKPPASPKT